MLSFEESNRPAQWLVEARGQVRTGNVLCQLFLADRDGGPPDTVEGHAWQVALMSGVLLHWGYAVEAAAKAVLVSHDPSAISQRYFKSHDLRKLVERTGCVVRYPIADLLERLTEYVLWAGRYPVPLTSERHTDAEGRLLLRPNIDQLLVADLVEELSHRVPESERS